VFVLDYLITPCQTGGAMSLSWLCSSIFGSLTSYLIVQSFEQLSLI